MHASLLFERVTVARMGVEKVTPEWTPRLSHDNQSGTVAKSSHELNVRADDILDSYRGKARNCTRCNLACFVNVPQLAKIAILDKASSSEWGTRLTDRLVDLIHRAYRRWVRIQPKTLVTAPHCASKLSF